MKYKANLMAGIVLFGLIAMMMAGSSSAEYDVNRNLVVHTDGGDQSFPLSEVINLTFTMDLPDGMVAVSGGIFTMGDGVSACGVDQREVTLTRNFFLGQHEVTNQEYLEAVQWAYDNGYVTATTSSVMDNLDGSTVSLLNVGGGDSEIGFAAGEFFLRDAGHGINPEHPVKMVTWYGAVRFCDWLSLKAGLPRAYEHTGDWSCNGGDPYSAAGFRLPTDAEMEYACQYNDERMYPWGNDVPECDDADRKSVV